VGVLLEAGGEFGHLRLQRGQCGFELGDPRVLRLDAGLQGLTAGTAWNWGSGAHMVMESQIRASESPP
jgi:hypothetical protein